jgi:hypothetical protein
VVTTLAGTLGLLFACFGGGPADPGGSIRNLHRYLGSYAVLAVIMLAGGDQGVELALKACLVVDTRA